MKKKVIAGIVLAGVAAFMLTAQTKGGKKGAAAPKMPAMPVSVVAVDKVIEMDDLENRNYTGLVVSKAVVQIIPRVSGEILKVGFADGSRASPADFAFSCPKRYHSPTFFSG